MADRLIKMIFSPMAFAIGFLWPLVTQVLLASGLMLPPGQVWVVSALLVAPFAFLAQIRGSWLWIK